MLEFAEVALDEIALAIDVRRDGSLDFSVFLGRDVSCGTHRFDLLDEGAGVVAAVGHHMAGPAQAGYQLGTGALVASLALRQGQADGQALAVDDGVDLGAQSPARETDGVIRTPFFPPAACWWARMMELSIKVIDSGDWSARALKTLTHTPALAHRLKRL